jgi:electron transfer flavoprotein alpha subunit
MQRDGKVSGTTFELIEAAKGLGGEITSVLLGENAGDIAGDVANRGGGKVLAVSHPSLKYYNDEIYTKVLSEIVAKHTPDLVIGPASFYGKALMARLAAKNGGSMASDCNGISADGGTVKVTRGSYGGSVISTISANGDSPFFVSIRPKIFNESTDGGGEVVNESVSDVAFEARMEVKQASAQGAGQVSLTEADRIVSAGRGLKGPENLDMVKDLAHSLGAAFGASRAIVDAGWTEYANQVGQTGKTVNPKLYIAVGISGAIQHLVGMRTSQTIVAINKDKDAPIFNVANYGIVGDAFDVVPALTKKFKEELAE